MNNCDCNGCRHGDVQNVMSDFNCHPNCQSDRGVVAVVQGLQDARLAVTVTDFRDLGRVGITRDANGRLNPHGLSKTCCSMPRERNRFGKSYRTTLPYTDPAVDNRYISSYRDAYGMAHSNSAPFNREYTVLRSDSTPAHRFPHDSTYTCPPVRDSSAIHTSSWTDNRDMCINDPFVSSLRKYTLDPPERSMSADLIHRLLLRSHAQARNLKKGAHTKSLRSLTEYQDVTKDDVPKTSKNIQTYTRARNEAQPAENEERADKKRRKRRKGRENSESPEKDVLNTSCSSSSPVRTETSPRTSPVRTETAACSSSARTDTPTSPGRMSPSVATPPRRAHHKSRSPPRRTESSAPRKISPQSSPTRTKIRPQSPLSSPRTEGGPQGRFMLKPEVRYMNDLTRYVTDVLMKQMYDLQPAQISPKVSPIQICCFCRKPLPCGCARRNRQLHIYIPGLFSPTTSCDVPQGESDEEIPERDYINIKIENVIYDWLAEVPVYASSSGNRCQRENVFRDLIEGIKNCYGHENFGQIVRDRAFECLCQLPMWFPNKLKKDEFRMEFVERLVQKLKNVKSKRDIFGEAVAKWFKQLCFKEIHNGKPVNKIKILKEFSNELRKTAFSQFASEEEYLNLLEEKAYTLIEEMPLLVEGNKIRANQFYTNDLMDRLARIPAKDVKKKLDYEPENEYEWEILDRLEDLPEFAHLTEAEGKNALKKLAKTLEKLKVQGLSSQEVNDQMDSDINEWVEYLKERFPVDVEMQFQKDILNEIERIPEIAAKNPADMASNDIFAKKMAAKLNILQKEGMENEAVLDQMLTYIRDGLITELKRKGIHIDIKTKQRLAENILDNLEKTVAREKNTLKLPRLYKKKINKWLQDDPDLASASPAEKRELEKISQKLANDLHHLQSSGTDENTRNLMLENIKNIYDTIHTQKDIAFTPKQKNKASELLADSILKVTNNVDAKVPLKELENVVGKQINEIVEDIPQLASSSNAEKKETEAMCNVLAKFMVEMASEGIEDEEIQNSMLDEIKSHLDQTIEKKQANIDENTRYVLAEKIFKSTMSSINAFEKTNKLPLDYEKIIGFWLNDIIELSGTDADTEENKKMSKSLANVLIALQAKGIDEVVKDQMRDEIDNRLQHTVQKRGKRLNPTSKNSYVENLLVQLMKWSRYALKGNVDARQIQGDFEKEVLDWSENIPQLASRTAKDKANKRQLSINLAKRLTQLYHKGLLDDDVRDEMLKEIISYMDIAMEQRGQNAIDDRDKEELSHRLLDTIVVKSEQVAQESNLTEAIKKHILSWMQNIPELSSSNSAELKQNNEMALLLAKQLVQLKSKGIDEEDFKKQAMWQIRNNLNSWLEQKCEHIDTKIKQKLVENLYEKIAKIFSYVVFEIPIIKIKEGIHRDIKEWLEDIPELNLETLDDQNEIINRLTKNLMTLHTELMNDEKIHQQMISTIKDELQTLHRKRGGDMDSSESLELAEILYDKVVTDADKTTKQLNMPNAFQKNVTNWIEDIPELASTDSATRADNDLWGRSLAKKLLNLHGKGSDQKELRNQMTRLAKTELDEALAKKGQQINQSTKIKLAENIVDKLIKQTDAAEKSSVPTKMIENQFKDDIEAWMYNIPQMHAGKLREDFIQKLSADLNNIQAMGIHNDQVQNRMMEKIMTNLENALSHINIDLPEEEKHRVAEDLLLTLTITGDNANKKQRLLGDIEKDIIHCIEDVPELASHKPSENKDNNEMARILAKKLHDMQAMGLDDEYVHDQILKEIKDQIHSTLEKKGEYINPNGKKKIAKKLFKCLSKSVKNAQNIQVPTRILRKAFQKEISEWMEEIPELASKGVTGIKENKVFMENLSEKLAELHGAGLDNYKDEMLEEIKSSLESIIEAKHEYMTASTKTKLAERLMTNIVGTAESEQLKIGVKHIGEKLKRDVKNWIEDINELNSANNYVKQKLFINENNDIRELTTQDMGDLLLQETAKNKIKEDLQYALGKKQIDPQTQDILAERLLYRAIETTRKYGTLYEISNAFYEIILQWFKSIPMTTSNSDSEQKQLENISRVLSLKIKDFLDKGKVNEETRCQILAEIKENLNCLLEIRQKQIEPSEKTRLCEELSNKLVDCYQHIKSNKIRVPLDKASENQLIDLITNWVVIDPDLPFDKSDEKSIQKISEKLAKNYNKLLAEGVPYEIVKAQIMRDITGELEPLLAEKGFKLTPKQKKNLSENLFNSMSNFANSKNKVQGYNNIESEIADALEQKYRELKSLGLSEDLIRQEMEKELNSQLAMRGKTLNANEKHQLLENLKDKFVNAEKLKADKEIADALGQKYRELKSLGLSEDLIRQEMEKELNRQLAMRGKTLNANEKHQLLENLKDKFADEEIADALGQKYRELKSLGLSEDLIRQEMEKELNRQLAMRGKTLNANEKHQLLENLIAKFGKAGDECDSDEHAMHREIRNWLRGLPGFPLTLSQIKRKVESWYNGIRELSSCCESENLTEELAMEIQCIINLEPNETLRRKQLQFTINEWLDCVSAEQFVQLCSYSKDNYTNTLMKEIENKNKCQNVSNRSNRQTFWSQSPRKNQLYNLSQCCEQYNSQKIAGCSCQRPPVIMKQKIKNPYEIYNMSESINKRHSTEQSKTNYRESSETISDLSKDLDDGIQMKIIAAIANNLDKLNVSDDSHLQNELISILKEAHLTDEESRMLSKQIVQAAKTNYEAQPKSDWTPMEKDAFKNKALANTTICIDGITGDLSSQDVRSMLSQCCEQYNSQKIAGCSCQRPPVIMKQKIKNPYEIYNMSESINRRHSTEQSKTNYGESSETIKDRSKDLDDGIQKKITAAIANNLDKLNVSDDSHLENELISILKEAHLTDEESRMLSKQIIQAAKTNYEAQPKSDWTPMEKNAFKNKALANTTVFLDGITGNLSSQDGIKVQEAKECAISNIADIMANSKLSVVKKEPMVKEEILKLLQTCPITSDKPVEELAKSHTCTIMNLADGPSHSTPRGSRDESSGYQRREQEYLNQVAEVIDCWAESLPETEMGPSSMSRTGLRETLTKDLAGDVVDRQRYLQINPGAKKSEADELEHLKYQTYRYLNKFLESRDLDRAMGKVPNLMEDLKRISVPQMVKQLGNRCHKKMDLVRLIDENLDTALENWLKKTPLYQKKPPKERLEQETLMLELAEALKNIVDQSTEEEEEVEEQLIKETVQRLRAILIDQSLSNDDTYLYKVAFQIFYYVRKQQRSKKGCCSSLPSDCILEDVVDDWIESLQTCNKSCKRNVVSNSEKKRFICQLKSLRQQYDTQSCQHEPAIRFVINKFLPLMVDPCKRSNVCFLSHKTEELISHLRTVHVELDESFTAYDPKPFKKPTDALFEDVNKWCNDLPISRGDSPEEEETGRNIKQDLTFKLVNKIGELNMNPEILNDEFLYEDLLTDEIDKILEDLPRNPELDKYLNPLKKELISRIKEGRQRIRDDLLGKVYKRQLRDTISTSIHISECLSPEEEASFEILKDNLADAYINLHYVTDNDEERNKLKRKILEEISEFSQQILRRYPGSTMNASSITKDLYIALRRIPVPRDESMKDEVEQARVKNIIDEWLKYLHLKTDSATTLLHRNKMAIILAKRIHEIEREKDVNPELESGQKIMEEAAKFLRKLSLGVKEDKIIEWADMLKCRLRCTEKFRVFNTNRPNCMTSQTSNTSIGPNGPPSSLTGEDRAHLQRIKIRNNKPCCLDASTSSLPRNAKPCCLDASTSSLPRDAFSQTDISLSPPYVPKTPSIRTVSCQTGHPVSAPSHPSQSISQKVCCKGTTTTEAHSCSKILSSRHSQQRARSPTEDSSEELLDCPSYRGPHVIKLGSYDYSCSSKRKAKKCDRKRRCDNATTVDEWSDNERISDTECCGTRQPKSRESRQVKEQCECKDRVLMVCKGCKTNNNCVKLYKDACSNCGNRCPHPNYYYK